MCLACVCSVETAVGDKPHRRGQDATQKKDYPIRPMVKRTGALQARQGQKKSDTGHTVFKSTATESGVICVNVQRSCRVVFPLG